MGNIYFSGFYAWETHAAQFIGRNTPLSILADPCSDVGAADNKDEVESVVEIDDNLQDKKLSVILFDLQKSKRKEIWLTNSQVIEFMHPLGPAFQKHKD